MDANALPTKRNLLQAKHNLSLARKGHNLLDMRQKAILHELNEIKSKIRNLRKILREDIITLYHHFAIAQMEFEQKNLSNLWEKPFSEGSIALDEAHQAWRLVTKRINDLSDAEATNKRLSELMRRTRKRAAALRNITIPTYEARIKYISEQLEERERDELVRIKAAKNSKEFRK